LPGRTFGATPLPIAFGVGLFGQFIVRVVLEPGFVALVIHTEDQVVVVVVLEEGLAAENSAAI
jgi:hypothetical protein